MKTICFVILHFGNIAVTEKCVASILRMNNQEHLYIILVNNDSSLHSQRRLRSEMTWEGIPNLTVIENRSGGGFSHANNLGYQYARNQLAADFIIMANNDIVFVQNSFPVLVYQAYDRHQCHVLGPSIIKTGTQEQQNPLDVRIRTRKEAVYTKQMNKLALSMMPFSYPVLCGYNMITAMVSKNRKSKYTRGYAQKNIVLFGACLIFTPLFIEKETSAFQPETNFYYEEYLLKLRCDRQGYLCVYDPDLQVYHETGAATRQSHRRNIERMKFLLKNTADSCEVYLRELGEWK